MKLDNLGPRWPGRREDGGCGVSNDKQRTGGAFRSSEYVPLSVREGGWRKRFGWRVKGWRQAVALRLAPWLTPMARYRDDEFDPPKVERITLGCTTGDCENDAYRFVEVEDTGLHPYCESCAASLAPEVALRRDEPPSSGEAEPSNNASMWRRVLSLHEKEGMK